MVKVARTDIRRLIFQIERLPACPMWSGMVGSLGDENTTATSLGG
jgi:hypothetical protein